MARALMMRALVVRWWCADGALVVRALVVR